MSENERRLRLSALGDYLREDEVSPALYQILDNTSS